MERLEPFPMEKFFNGKTVLVTGHTGFKGAWLTAWLKLLGAEVVGLSLGLVSNPSHFSAANMGLGIQDLRVDIRDQLSLQREVISVQPDFVFHLAAQSLVGRSYEDPVETWQVNLLGTLHLLESLRHLNKKCSAVIITSDKCYDNVEWEWGYRETDALGGPDPYSASKGAAELAVRSYIKSYFPGATSPIRIASARAGNVIGGGDWAHDRIIPDCVRAWSAGIAVELRKPNATRPWQHVLEPLSGYLNLAIALSESPEVHGQPFNFGPQAQQNHSVLELAKEMAVYWDQVKWVDVSGNLDYPHESGLLKLNCDKSLYYLGWHAIMNFSETIKITAEWYKAYYENASQIADLTKAQITSYIVLAKERHAKWAK